MAEAATPERKMKRSLTAFDLTCLGIGAIIGSGIFALAGTAAAGERAAADLRQTPVINFIQAWISNAPLDWAGQARGRRSLLSFVVAAFRLRFAALCYAELASMIPVSGSAYTYSYATLGEIVAWIIGWDLILEYAVGNMAVAVGWSGYFVKLCGSLFGLKFPLWAVSDYKSAADIIKQGGDVLQDFSSTSLPVVAGHPIALNLPALVIVMLVTMFVDLWNPGKRENKCDDRHHQSGGGSFFIAFGAFLVQSDELASVHADRVWWRYERRGHRVLRFHRV